MARRNPSLVVSLCTSMTLHTLLLCAMAWWYVRHPPREEMAFVEARSTRAPIVVDAAPPPESAAADQSLPEQPPPAPEKIAEKPDDFDSAEQAPLKDDSGEQEGTGTANRSTPGHQPMQARRGLEQANLARTPVLNDPAHKHNENLPLPAQDGVAEGGENAAPPQYGVSESHAAPVDPNRSPTVIAMTDPSLPGPLPQGSASLSAAPNGSPTAPRDVPPPLAPALLPQAIEGHDSINSDTDSMAFAKENSVTFRDGKLEGRQGRKVRTTRIQFGLAAESDALRLGRVGLQLGVSVDAGGNVRNVKILHSSGSDNIDLPSQRAIYNWWFEPKKGKDGNTLPDLWVVTIE